MCLRRSSGIVSSHFVTHTHTQAVGCLTDIGRVKRKQTPVHRCPDFVYMISVRILSRNCTSLYEVSGVKESPRRIAPETL